MLAPHDRDGGEARRYASRRPFRVIAGFGWRLAGPRRHGAAQLVAGGKSFYRHVLRQMQRLRIGMEKKSSRLDLTKIGKMTILVIIINITVLVMYLVVGTTLP